MGAGKSTVGETIARRLGWTFRDLDAWVEERNVLSVARIFAERGEAFFRQEERQVAEAARGLKNHVLAAGGGAFAEPATRAALQDRAATVWLRCDLETILKRVGEDASRPLAAGRERMSALLAEREPSYRMAEFTVETTGVPPGEIAERIVHAVFPDRGLGGTER
jgi:shikimate kinase